jgi:fumarate hydratase class II
MGGAEGNFELNAFRPILINNYLHSALILADMCDHIRKFMIEGTQLNEAKLKENIDNSVMMVTALSPVIGYDKSAAISYYAIDHNLTPSSRPRWPRASARNCSTRSSSPWR